MSIELTITNLIAILIGAIGGIATLIKIIAVLFERSIKGHYDQINLRLTALDSAFKLDAAQWQRVERELLNLKAELPLNYVRREDYIRGQSIIESKLDGLGMKLENAQLRAAVRVS